MSADTKGFFVELGVYGRFEDEDLLRKVTIETFLETGVSVRSSRPLFLTEGYEQYLRILQWNVRSQTGLR